MWLGMLILAVVAVAMLIIAHKIAAGNTGLIHSWHTQQVKEEDRLQYAKSVANGLRVMGAGFLLAAGFMYKEMTMAGLLAIFISLILGAVIIGIGQKRYG